MTPDCGLCSHGLPMSGGSSKSTKPRKNIKKGGGLPVIESGISSNIQWQKVGSSGNSNLDIWLAKGQTIIADKHAMIYMDGEIDFKTEMGKIKKALGRMLSGESMFLSHYTGTNPNKSQRISLGIPVPGDIVCLPLEPQKSWKVSRGCFLAGTSNVVVSGKLNPKGFFSIGQQEGGILQTVKVETEPGHVWLGSYGHIEKHELKAGESLYVDNENFLACPKEVDYSISKVGNVKSLVLGGEGFAMKFVGPCVVYTQSKGIIALVKELYKYFPTRN
jgi:uncharacterized protein (TIGR00266 family)